jgi:Polysaccharide lyase
MRAVALQRPATPKRPGFLADWSTASPGRANVNQCGQLNSIAREFPSRMEFVETPVDQGKGSMRMELRQGDVDHSTRERVQLRPTNPPRTYFSEGVQNWEGFSFYFLDDFYIPAIIGVDDVVLYDGFPNTPDLKGGGLSTVNSVVIGPGSGSGATFVLSINGGETRPDGKGYIHNTDQPFGSPKKKVWHRFLKHNFFSQGEDGYVELWHQEVPLADARGVAPSFLGAPVVKDTGPNVAVSSAGTVFSMYPQFGAYRHTNPQTSTLCFGGATAQATREMAEALWR